MLEGFFFCSHRTLQQSTVSHHALKHHQKKDKAQISCSSNKTHSSGWQCCRSTGLTSSPASQPAPSGVRSCLGSLCQAGCGGRIWPCSFSFPPWSHHWGCTEVGNAEGMRSLVLNHPHESPCPPWTHKWCPGLTKSLCPWAEFE